MKDRPNQKYRPALERLEGKQCPSGAGFGAFPGRAAIRTPELHAKPQAVQPKTGFLVYRITNPNRFNQDSLVPPFDQILVQRKQPIPGQVYNILFVSVRNGTAQTFTASDDMSVGVPGQKEEIPILTGDDTWRPGETKVFYIMTKKYYPLRSQVSDGFLFTLGGVPSTAIPGPSGIALRITYDPTRFQQTLNRIVAFGVGNQGGKGIKFGLPNTSIYEFVSAKTNRNDFGGYF